MRVLTVDDSRAIRMIVSKVIAEMGFDIDEAEDGEQGLAKLEELDYDLIILDVTMPVLDGPGMLAKMRERGKNTPVLMLTSESKRSIVSELMKLKIEDYILKPFKNDELKAKIARILKQKDPGVMQALNSKPMVTSAPEPRNESPESSGARQFADVLVVDDMENVPKKLRTMLPAHVTMLSAPTGQAALKMAREATFRLVIIDRELPDVPGPALLKQIRVLQPAAACLATALRSNNSVSNEVKDEGFDDALFKPFSQDAIDDLMSTYFQTQELISRENNVISPAVFTGKADRMDRYYSRVSALCKDAVRVIAEACFEGVIFDAGRLPPDPTRLAQMITELNSSAKAFGMTVQLVGNAAVARALKDFADTKDVVVHESLSQAKEALGS
jgi:two-component system cell cycle response regulator